MTAQAEAGPVLVVRGAPTPQELAALLAVLLRGRASAPAAGQPASRWNDRATLLRHQLDRRPPR